MGRVSVWVGAAALAFGSASLVVFAAPVAEAAGLPPGCVLQGTGAVCSYTADGTFTVPAAVSEIDVVAVGGNGAAGSQDDIGIPGGPGGLGGMVHSTFVVGPTESVSAGDTLSISIGGNAFGRNGGAHGGGTGAPGFFLTEGGGGGGATALGSPHPIDPLLVVAAGGGGGGASYDSTGGSGGAGNGADGTDLPSAPGGNGGTGASGAVHGVGGTNGCADSANAAPAADGFGPDAGGGGGNGAVGVFNIAGGGGGAGYAGGGGGGSGCVSNNQFAGGGGGGAGSSLSAGLTSVFALGDGNPRLVITFDASAISVTGLDPSITGLPQARQTLTAHAGPVSPADSTLSYVWNAGGVPIAGEIGPTLHLTNALAGKQITVTITASHTGYDPETETSAATDYVRQYVAQPKLSLDDNTPARGQTVTVLAQGLQPGSTYTLTNRYIPGGSVEEVADQYGEIHLDVTIPANASVGYDVVGIYGYDPPTAASVTYRVH